MGSFPLSEISNYYEPTSLVKPISENVPSVPDLPPISQKTRLNPKTAAPPSVSATRPPAF